MVISNLKYTICPVRDKMLVEKFPATFMLRAVRYGMWRQSHSVPDGTREIGCGQIFYQHSVPSGTDKPLHVIYSTLLKHRFLPVIRVTCCEILVKLFQRKIL
jgi:hypothetical protein